jgi:hypothetical protein
LTAPAVNPANCAIGSAGTGNTNPAALSRNEVFDAAFGEAMNYSVIMVLLSHLWKTYLLPS